jgi:hypothetical protein
MGWVGVVSAAPQESAPGVIQFSLRPRMCVLSAKESRCDDQITATWQSSETKDICLYRQGGVKAIACWVGKKEGQHTFVLSTDEAVSFQLRRQEKLTSKRDTVLASETFLVTQSQKKYRRARRNPWSFF